MSLRELYGLEGSAWQQYTVFWKRILRADFGPSMSAFPTPVSTLIARALPWTTGLLVVSTIVTWVLGNWLGGLAGYYQKSRGLKLMGVIAMGLHPIPYYILALLLLIVFGFLWPVLPISGGSAMNLPQAWTWAFAASVLKHSILPALSLILIGVGSWFLGMRSLVSNVVTEDYVIYAELAGVKSRRILSSYVMRNALVPQVTGLAISLGGIFNGGHHREGVRLSRHRHAAGRCRLRRRLRARARRHHDLHPRRIDRRARHRPALSTARSPGQGELMLGILRDLLRYNAEFRIGIVLVGFVLVLSVLAGFSPYPPQDVYVVPPDVPPSLSYWLGTTSRGQDVFWQLTFAIRNTLLFGCTVALISRVLALLIGLLSGYKGGWIDRVLMSINDTFIVIPLLPVLVLFYFVMRDSMSWLMLALIMACLGWAYDARLIRSVAMSLKTREFTQSSVFSGMSTREILVQEHLPYVMPIVFSTTMNNMIWSIGLEVTLAVLGFTDINTPTIGGMIYWANQHTAMVAGVWWWIAFPTIAVVITFIGLFLLAVSMNEYIDPRSRLSRIGRVTS